MRAIRSLTVIAMVACICSCRGGTGVTELMVSSTVPADGESGIAVTSTITVVFNRALNVNEVEASAITLTSGGVSLPGALAYDDDTKTLTFTPSSNLATNTTYTAAVMVDLQSLVVGATNVDHTWSFTSASAPWTRQIGTSAHDDGRSIALDAEGNIYVTGYTGGDLDGNTSAGGPDIPLVKYDSSGIRRWTRQLGTQGNDYGEGVAIDSSGDVYVTGGTDGSLDGNTSAGGTDIYVAKYDATGAKLWTRQVGTENNDYGNDIAVDNSGNVYVTGWTGGNLDGTTVVTGDDFFILKYDASGTLQWKKQYGTAVNDYAYGIDVDTAGNVYVTGDTGGDMDGNVNAGGADIFAVRLNSSGVEQWTGQFGAAGNEGGVSVAVDASGNVYVAGSTAGDLDGNTSAGGTDAFVVKYDSAGTRQWTRQFGTADDDEGKGVAVDQDGNVYVTGPTAGGLDGNAGAGAADLFLVKFNPAGSKQWTSQLGTSSFDSGMDVAVAGGYVYLTGVSGGDLDGNINAGGGDIIVVKYDLNGTKQ